VYYVEWWLVSIIVIAGLRFALALLTFHRRRQRKELPGNRLLLS
jgi:hypothetical protein